MAAPSLRVVLFSESYLPYLSGVTVSVDALARGLGDAGHRVLVVAPRPVDGRAPAGVSRGPEPEYAWLPSYQLGGVAPPGYRMPWPLPWLAAPRVTRFRPDVIHAHSPFVSGLGALHAARRSGVPLVFTHHTRFGDYRHYLGPLAAVGSRVVDGYLEHFWRACAAIVAPSENLATEIRSRLGARRRPLVRALPTGIDVAAIAAAEPIDVRHEAGWPPETVVAVTLGRLALEKSVDVLVEAFALAAGRVPSLRLVVIGSGPAEAAMRARAAQPDVAGRVAFTGLLPRSEAIARVKSCNLFVFASQTETQGLVLAEALAGGVPVVTLDGPAVGETVRDGIDGRVVPFARQSERTAALADAMAALALDPRAAAEMGARARGAAERFDTSAAVARVAQLYREAIG